jgi:hypothetical protein
MRFSGSNVPLIVVHIDEQGDGLVAPVETRRLQPFADGKAVASYIGIIPREHSSGARQPPGAVSKQGNALLRYLWCAAAIGAAERDPELKRFYRRKLVQKGLGKARVAADRKLEIRLWIMLRDHMDYNEFVAGSSNKSSWSTVTREMSGGHHRFDVGRART